MLNTCPNCGVPVCSECGNHVSPGAVGAPTFMRGIQPAGTPTNMTFKKPVAVAIAPIVTWDTIHPPIPGHPSNETYLDMYAEMTLLYVPAASQRVSTFTPTPTKQMVANWLRSTFSIPAVADRWAMDGSPMLFIEYLWWYLAGYYLGINLKGTNPPFIG